MSELGPKGEMLAMSIDVEILSIADTAQRSREAISRHDLVARANARIVNGNT
jgi:hypothetical protein